MKRRSFWQQGFTLLELIVVLLLVSFITALLMQGLAYVARTNERYLAQGAAGQQRELVLGWFRDSIGSLAAPSPGDDAERFRGDEHSFEAITLAAADRREGVPTAFAFRLEEGGEKAQAFTNVIYVRRLEAARWLLMQMPGDARFQYQDEAGDWHDQWPPSAILADSLPAAVALFDPAASLFVLASVETPHIQVRAGER